MEYVTPEDVGYSSEALEEVEEAAEASGVGYGYMWYVFPDGSALADMAGAPGFYHTGIGVHVLVMVPEHKLVIVQRDDTDGEWEDAGDIGMQIGLMIMDARIKDWPPPRAIPPLAGSPPEYPRGPWDLALLHVLCSIR